MSVESVTPAPRALVRRSVDDDVNEAQSSNHLATVYKHVKAPPIRDVAFYNPSSLGRYAPSGSREIINQQHSSGGALTNT